MSKKIISVIICVLIVFSAALPAAAYQPNGFTLNAQTAMLVSMDTDEVLYEKNADKKVYPASITKIMTVLLMLESDRYDPNGTVTMTADVDPLITGTGSSVSNLKVGEQIKQIDLAYLVLMASYGDCAYLLALTYGDTVENFVKMMNDKASELGLKGTHYTNPVGLHDENNYTTARDTYVLTSYALKNSTFKEICGTARHTIEPTNMSEKRTLSTTNFLLDTTTNYYYQYATGVKTGYTDEAGRCLVSTASYNGYNYMCILFGCTPNAGKRYEFEDSKNLYRWAFNNFVFKQVAESDTPVCEIGVELSLSTDFVSLYVDRGFISVLPKDADESTISIIPKLDSETVDAPIKKGQVLGTADIVYAEQVIGTVNLVSHEDVSQSFLLKVLRGIKRFFSAKYMKLVYIVLAVAVLVFIGAVIKLNYGRGKKRRVKYIPYDKDKDK